MKTICSILICGLLSGFAVMAQTVSLTATAPVAGTGLSAPLVVQTNQVIKFLHAYSPPEANPTGDQTRTPIISVTINTNTFEYVQKLDFTVAGPATIRLKVKNTNTFFQDPCTVYATFLITDNQPLFSPGTGTAVVIPSDATGPVNILLESSPDLVSWTGALPGTYGSSTTNRFFRVRAVRQ